MPVESFPVVGAGGIALRGQNAPVDSPESLRGIPIRGGCWGVPPLARRLSPLGELNAPYGAGVSRQDHKPSAARRPSLRQHYAGVVAASGGPHRQQVCARCSDPHVGSRAHAARGILSELAGCRRDAEGGSRPK
jgi:hypothetical protein